MSDLAATPPARLPARRLALNPVYIVLALLIAAIAIQSPHFLEPAGYMNFLKRAAPLAILAAGQVYVITSGGFDLSVGSIITLTVIGSSILINGDPNATAWVIPLMLGIGVAVGLINGAVVSYLKVPSIIATLGMMITLNGVALTWSGGSPRGYLPDSFRYFGRAMISDLPLIGILPIALIVLVVIGGLLWWLMHRTVYGRLVHAVGDNPRAAQLAGTPVERVRIIAFVDLVRVGGARRHSARRFRRRFDRCRLRLRIAGDHRRRDRRSAASRRARLGRRIHRRGADIASHLHAVEHARLCPSRSATRCKG